LKKRLARGRRQSNRAVQKETVKKRNKKKNNKRRLEKIHDQRTRGKFSNTRQASEATHHLNDGAGKAQKKEVNLGEKRSPQRGEGVKQKKPGWQINLKAGRVEDGGVKRETYFQHQRDGMGWRLDRNLTDRKK